MSKVIETGTTFEIQDMMPLGRRVLFALLALLPLLAPYELLLRPHWTDYFNLVFLFFLIVSLGALTVSALLLWAAIAGLSKVLRFDRSTGLLIYQSGAPIVRWRKTEQPLSDVEKIAVNMHEWTDGAPSYSMDVTLRSGQGFRIGSSWNQEEIETMVRRANEFMVK